MESQNSGKVEYLTHPTPRAVQYYYSYDEQGFRIDCETTGDCIMYLSLSKRDKHLPHARILHVEVTGMAR